MSWQPREYLAEGKYCRSLGPVSGPPPMNEPKTGTAQVLNEHIPASSEGLISEPSRHRTESREHDHAAFRHDQGRSRSAPAQLSSASLSHCLAGGLISGLVARSGSGIRVWNKDSLMKR